MLCCEASLVNYGINQIRAVIMFCNSWGCDICLPRRKNRLLREIQHGLPDKLLTLTTRHVEGACPVAEARRQGEAFKQLIRRIRERWPGKEVEYFAVREATKKGWPHLHVCLRCPFLPHSWLKAQWLDLTGSPGVDIRKIWRPHIAARYVAKYVGKAPHQFGTCKRYWMSRRWLDPYEPPPPRPDAWQWKWEVVREGLWAVRERYRLRGWETNSNGCWDWFEAWKPP